MHVKDLRVALQEIEEVFAAAGAKPVQKDLASVLELFNDNDHLDLSAFLDDLRESSPPRKWRGPRWGNGFGGSTGQS